MNLPREQIKGDAEVRVVKELLKYLQITPFSSPEKQVPPEPDVHFQLDAGKVIGVEATALQLDDFQSRRIQPEIRQVLKAAQKQYAASGKVPLAVRIYSSLRPGNILTLTKTERALVAGRLVDLISARCPKAGQQTFVSEEEAQCDPLLSQLFITEIYLHAVESGHPHWTVCESALTPMATVPEIEATVALKERRVSKYLRKYHEVWLLIHTGYGPEPLNAARYPPANLETDFAFNSSFGRVFFMSSSDGLHQLRTNPPT